MATSRALYWPYPPSQVGTWPGDYKGHTGTDWPKPNGTPVPATSDGVIVFVGDDGLGGKTIDLQREDGLIQRFGHLSAIWVTSGQRVTAGNTIGLVGSTGNSTGPHLHWELRWDRVWTGGNWIDPRTMNPLSFGITPPPEPEPTPEIEDDLMAIYLRPEGNSTPITDKDPITGKPVGKPYSRIWADERKIGGVTYSGTWERSDNGTVRRLYPGEWEAIKRAYAAVDRPIPLSPIAPNDLEKMVYLKR